MKRKKALLLVFIITALGLNAISASAASSDKEWDLSLPSLKDTFADYFGVGNIMEPRDIFRESTEEMFRHHYNFVTAENAMKPSNMSSSNGTYSFQQQDLLVNWAIDNDIKVIGHALVWHSQSARWLTGTADAPVTRAEARENMEQYINKVAGHYAGKIHSWDVVNEALLTSISTALEQPPEGWWKTQLRTASGGNDASPWYAAYANGMNEEAGEHPGDYIYDAFVFARLADPDAILYYNDFNETEQGKREAIAQMTEELNAKWETDPRNTESGRLLIEGIGMQAHYWTSDLVPAAVGWSIERFAQTGAIISISELDIPMGRWRGYQDATEENLQKQAELYFELFVVFMRHADVIERVTFWGKADPQSWRKDGHPLLFDADFEAKPAFHSIMMLAPPEEPPAEEEPEEEPEIPENSASEPEKTDKRVLLSRSSILMLVGGGLLLVGGGIIMLNKRK